MSFRSKTSHIPLQETSSSRIAAPTVRKKTPGETLLGRGGSAKAGSARSSVVSLAFLDTRLSKTNYWNVDRVFGKVFPSFAHKWLLSRPPNVDRESQYDRPYYYALAVLSCTLSLSDLSEFPAFCFLRGGLVFLLFHLFFTVILGFPIFFLENFFGQKTGHSVLHIVAYICPIAGGFGWAVTLARIFELFEQSIRISWMFQYLFGALSPTIPWEKCGNHWNSFTCFTSKQNQSCYENVKSFYYHLSCDETDSICRKENMTLVNEHYCYHYNKSEAIHVGNILEKLKKTHPGNEFLSHIRSNTLGFSFDTIYTLSAYTLFWVLIYICIRRGQKTAIQVTHVNAILSVIGVVFLLVAILLLPGAGQGMHHLLIDGWSKTDERSLFTAMRTSLDSLSLGYAVNFMFGRNNEYSYNFAGVAAVVVAIDFVFLVFITCVVSSLIGMAAKIENLNVSQYMEKELAALTDHSGTELLLGSAPKIFLHFPAKNFVTAMFFIFCITISLDLVFVIVETVVISALKVAPRVKAHLNKLRIGICVLLWVLGLVLFTEDGLYAYKDMYRFNHIDAKFVLFVEVIVLTWGYGLWSPVKYQHFTDLRGMLGSINHNYYRYLWVTFYVVAPVCLFIKICWICYYAFTDDMAVLKEKTDWTCAFYLMLMWRSVIILVGYALYKIAKTYKNGEPLRTILFPRTEWLTLRDDLAKLKI